MGNLIMADETKPEREPIEGNSDRGGEFRIETGKFESDPEKASWRSYAEEGAHGLESFQTPERLQVLRDISSKLYQNIQKYGVEGKVYDPNLIGMSPMHWLILMGPQPDPWGQASINIERASIELFPQAIAADENYNPSKQNQPIDTDKAAGVLIHEELHLYSRRVRKIETDSRSEVYRMGLRFSKEGNVLWNWVNEAVIEDLSQEEYRRITGKETKIKGYEILVEQYHKLVEVMAAKSGLEQEQVKEIFRGACIGKGSLLPMGRIIKSFGLGVMDFIKLTDAPSRLAFSVEQEQAVFAQLMEELGSDVKGSKFQEALLKDYESLSALTARKNLLEKLARDIFRKLNEIYKAEREKSDPANLEDDLTTLVEKLKGEVAQFIDDYPVIKNLFDVDELQKCEDKMERENIVKIQKTRYTEKGQKVYDEVNKDSATTGTISYTPEMEREDDPEPWTEEEIKAHQRHAINSYWKYVDEHFCGATGYYKPFLAAAKNHPDFGETLLQTLQDKKISNGERAKVLGDKYLNALITASNQ